MPAATSPPVVARDAPGNPGGDGGATTGGDVAAGIQQRLPAPGFGLRGGGDLHHGLLTSQRIGARDDAGKDEYGYCRVQDAFAHAGALALALPNAQRAQVVSW